MMEGKASGIWGRWTRQQKEHGLQPHSGTDIIPSAGNLLSGDFFLRLLLVGIQ